MIPAKSHYVCVMIWRVSPHSQAIEFLVLDSTSVDPRTGEKTKKQTKFPGGCNRIPGEAVELTMQREALEETFLTLLPEATEQVWEKEKNPLHTKYGFLVPHSACRGELRGDVLDDNGDVMSPPYWINHFELRHLLYDTHQEPFIAACRKLGVM